MEQVLKTKGFGVGKVCILVAGPDFPTSMLCGILKLNIPQVLLGTSPVILVSIIPQTLVGALLARDTGSAGSIDSMISTVATGGAAAAQVASTLIYTYYIMNVIEKDGQELAKPRPEHAAVAELTAKEAAFVRCYDEVTAWDVIACPNKSMLCLAVGGLLLGGYLMAADFMLEDKFCFR